MPKNKTNLLNYIAVFGNAIYFLWVLWNGIDEGGKTTPVQTISFIGVLFLFIFNIVLLLRRR